MRRSHRGRLVALKVGLSAALVVGATAGWVGSAGAAATSKITVMMASDQTNCSALTVSATWTARRSQTQIQLFASDSDKSGPGTTASTTVNLTSDQTAASFAFHASSYLDPSVHDTWVGLATLMTSKGKTIFSGISVTAEEPCTSPVTAGD